MRRGIILLLPLLALLVFTWGRGHLPPVDRDLRIHISPEALPPAQTIAAYLGPFRLDGAWQLTSRNSDFFGYSSMVPQADGRILAVNDWGGYLWFSPPGAPGTVSRKAAVIGHALFGGGKHKKPVYQDSESTVYDPATHRYWLGVEGSNSIVRLGADLVEQARVRPVQMAHWGENTGPEAMTRLPDGRFVVIREIPLSPWGSRLHEAVLFDGDPIEHPAGHRFLFDGPDNFSAVDMAMLPDGRVLILMRRLIWPLPMRFAGRIVIADPAQIRPGQVWHTETLASLASVLPVDNFEAIGVAPSGPDKTGPDKTGRVTVWIMSDDNDMRVLQRTLLWKLSVDPRQLPWPGR